MEKATWVAADPAAECCGAGGRLSKAQIENFTEFLRISFSVFFSESR